MNYLYSARFFESSAPLLFLDFEKALDSTNLHTDHDIRLNMPPRRAPSIQSVAQSRAPSPSPGDAEEEASPKTFEG